MKQYSLILRKSGILTAMLLSFALAFAGETPLIRIETDHTALVFKVGQNGRLYQTYLGNKLLQNTDYEAVSRECTKKFVLNDGNPLVDLRHTAYPTYGTDDLFQPAIRMTHADGNPSLELTFKDVTSLPKEDGTETVIRLKDPVYPVDVALHFRTYGQEDVIEAWTEMSHLEKKPVVLYDYASSVLYLDADRYGLTQFHSDCVKEAQMEESELTHGTKVIDSRLGVRNAMFAVPGFYLSVNGKATENTGEVLAATLAWSGNFRLAFDVDNTGSLRIVSGINPYASEYSLRPGEVFTTPALILTHSDCGKGQASRNLHAWARRHGLKDGRETRLTLLNNWETTFFNFDEKKLTGMFADAKTLGVDMFLLDDGWFGNKYPRSGSTSGLGDWQATKSKLPNGLGFLTEEATRTGVKFGLWIEPEMVNEKSELYDQHPDWVLKLPNRPAHTYRTQLVLDMSNPAVQDFVFQTVDGLMQTGSGISYLKWDCNRMMTHSWSSYLKEKQSHLYIDYTRGLYKVLDRIREKYPHLPMMLCAGGGGRADYGFLKYFTEFWASDNTDPYDRVFIQWGFSHLFPAHAVCNHVTSWGDESIKFRTDVAMSGKLGFDVNVGGLKDYELRYCQQAIANYKRLASVIGQGDLYRLISPYDEERAVLQYVDSSRTKSVVFSYTMHPLYDPRFRAVRLQGLDPLKRYKVEEINLLAGVRRVLEESGQAFTGDFLMNAGLKLSSPVKESSVVLEINAVP